MDIKVIEEQLAQAQAELKAARNRYDKAEDEAHKCWKRLEAMEDAPQGTYTDEEIDKIYAEYNEPWQAQHEMDEEIYRLENIVRNLQEVYNYLDDNY